MGFSAIQVNISVFYWILITRIHIQRIENCFKIERLAYVYWWKSEKVLNSLGFYNNHIFNMAFKLSIVWHIRLFLVWYGQWTSIDYQLTTITLPAILQNFLEFFIIFFNANSYTHQMMLKYFSVAGWLVWTYKKRSIIIALLHLQALKLLHRKHCSISRRI